MNARIAGLFGLAALVAGAALSCKSDPTADGAGTPSQVFVNFKTFNMAVGDSVTVTARVVDVHSTPLEDPITFTACDPSVTVVVDPSFNPQPPIAARAIIHAIGPNATCVVASSGGAKPDTTAIVVLPTSFDGALSAASLDAGQVLTISSTSNLKFDTATVAVTFAGGQKPPLISKTADAIQLLVPFTDPGPLSIAGIAVTYVNGLDVTLHTTTSFTQTGSDPFPGDNAWNTAPDITSLLPASGQTAWLLATEPASNAANICPEARFGFGPSGNCAILKFTLLTPATVLFATDWDGSADSTDNDFLICSDSTAASFSSTTFAPCNIDLLVGASAAKPEFAGGVAYPAGTYWYVAQDFDGAGVKNFYIKIEVQ